MDPVADVIAALALLVSLWVAYQTQLRGPNISLRRVDPAPAWTVRSVKYPTGSGNWSAVGPGEACPSGELSILLGATVHLVLKNDGATRPAAAWNMSWHVNGLAGGWLAVPGGERFQGTGDVVREVIELPPKSTRVIDVELQLMHDKTSIGQAIESLLRPVMGPTTADAHFDLTWSGDGSFGRDVSGKLTIRMSGQDAGGALVRWAEAHEVRQSQARWRTQDERSRELGSSEH